jgi:hypothetical protein
MPRHSFISRDCDQFDPQLVDELNHDESAFDQSKYFNDKTPVPLLTPPESPLTVVLDTGIATICEWPSNLVIDSAIQLVNELRSLSPASLELLENNENDRIGSELSNIGDEATGLLPD